MMRNLLGLSAPTPAKLVGLASCLILLLLFIGAPVRQTFAQDEEAAPAAEQPAGAAGDPQSEARTEHPSYLWWLIESSGAIGFVLLCLSMYFIATVIRLFTEMRMEVAAPVEDVTRCEDLIRERNFKGAFEYMKESDTILGRTLSAGIGELSNGLPDAREALERAAEAETVQMEKSISMLAVIGTLGPMIGLLGTLKGMIASFSVIALSDTQLKASEVAGGISEALILTFEGVGLSVPAIFFYAIFRNRVSSISVQTSLIADQLLRHFYTAARSKTPAAAAP